MAPRHYELRERRTGHRSVSATPAAVAQRPQRDPGLRRQAGEAGPVSLAARQQALDRGGVVTVDTRCCVSHPASWPTAAAPRSSRGAGPATSCSRPGCEQAPTPTPTALAESARHAAGSHANARIAGWHRSGSGRVGWATVACASGWILGLLGGARETTEPGGAIHARSPQGHVTAASTWHVASPRRYLVTHGPAHGAARAL